MTFYFCIAGITSFLAWTSEKVKSQKLRYTLLGVVVLIFCLVAALRNVTVGRDTSYYGYPTYEEALKYDFLSFMDPNFYPSWGFFYKLVAWVTSNLFGTFQAYLFVAELCVVLPVVVVGCKVSKGNIPLVVALFALYFYPYSFNLIKQSIAMSFLLFAYLGLDRGNLKCYFIWLIVAALFHTSALCGLLLLGVYYIAKCERISTAKKLFSFAIFSILAVFVMPFVLNMIAQYFSHYSLYVGDGTLVVKGHGYRSIFERTFTLIVLFILGSVFNTQGNFPQCRTVSRRTEVLLLTTLFGVVITGISFYSLNLGRVALYFVYFSILLIPLYAKLIPKKNDRMLFSVVAVFLFALISIDTFAITGQCEVVPYVFWSF